MACLLYIYGIGNLTAPAQNRGLPSHQSANINLEGVPWPSHGPEMSLASIRYY